MTLRIIVEKDLLEKTRKRLEDQFGHPPSDGDLDWALLNIKGSQFSREGSWGMFRNVRLEQAEHLRKQKRKDEALGFYLEVCYLDLNGATWANPTWNPKKGEVLLFVAEHVVKITSALGLSQDALKECFLKRAERVASTMSLPLSPADAWKKLAVELAK